MRHELREIFIKGCDDKIEKKDISDLHMKIFLNKISSKIIKNKKYLANIRQGTF